MYFPHLSICISRLVPVPGAINLKKKMKAKKSRENKGKLGIILIVVYSKIFNSASLIRN